MQAAADWEALPAGTRLRVWWAGSGEAFECTIRDWHVAVLKGGKLFYTHRCAPCLPASPAAFFFRLLRPRQIAHR